MSKNKILTGFKVVKNHLEIITEKARYYICVADYDVNVLEINKVSIGRESDTIIIKPNARNIITIN